jgi:hypothetical protein
VDGAVGALPSLCFDRARDLAHLSEIEYVGVRGK